MTLRTDLNRLIDKDTGRSELGAAGTAASIDESAGVAAISAGAAATGQLKPPLRIVIETTTERVVTSDNGDVSVTVEDAKTGKIIDATGAEFAFTDVQWP